MKTPTAFLLVLLGVGYQVPVSSTTTVIPPDSSPSRDEMRAPEPPKTANQEEGVEPQAKGRTSQDAVGSPDEPTRR